MTRLLDVMEDYLCWKQYRYLRLDGHTSGCDRGALIDQFNQPGSPFFIFLLRYLIQYMTGNDLNICQGPSLLVVLVFSFNWTFVCLGPIGLHFESLHEPRGVLTDLQVLHEPVRYLEV